MGLAASAAGRGRRPRYESYCADCKKEVSLVLTMEEREEGNYACPECKGRQLESCMAGFYAKTSPKS